MTASVDSGFSGWWPYVLLNPDGTPRREAELVAGNIELGNSICNSLDYKTGNYFRLVISFDLKEFSPKSKKDRKKARKIVKEYIRKLMHGYRPDEYHVDIVEHADTDHLHYHVRIPKLNLLTGTQLHYHYLSDIERKDLIHSYMAAKYDLIDPATVRGIKPRRTTGEKIEQIVKWRKEHGQKIDLDKFDLTKKKERDRLQEEVWDHIQTFAQEGLIESLDDVRAELKALGFTVGKSDYDRTKKFHYTAVEKDGRKIRLRGDIYGEEFWRSNAEDRRAALKTGRSISAIRAADRPSLSEIERRLERANKRRAAYLEKRYGKAREQALRRIEQAEKAPDLPSPYRPNPRPVDRNIRHVEPAPSPGGGDPRREDRNRAGRDEVDQTPRPAPRQYRKGEINDDGRRIEKEIIARIGALRTDQERRVASIKRSTERIVGANVRTLDPAGADYRAVEAAVRSRQLEKTAGESVIRVLRFVAKRVDYVKRKIDRGNQIVRRYIKKIGKERIMLELEKFKREINLAEFATSFGYVKDRDKSSINAPVMRHPETGDKIVVGRDSKDRHYTYFNPNNDGDSGSIIDFVQRRTGETLGHVRKRLRAWLSSPSPAENIPVKASHKDTARIASIWERLPKDDPRSIRYFGLPPLSTSKLAHWKKVKYSAKDGAFYFLLNDVSGIAGIEKRTKEEKHIISGSRKGLFSDGDLSTAERILVFESPIDAISYDELKLTRPGDFIVATMGSVGEVAEEGLRAILSRNKTAEVIVATDNDEGGEKIAEKISSLLVEIERSTDRAKRHAPNEKDWNDELKVKKRQKKTQQTRSTGRGIRR